LNPLNSVAQDTKTAILCVRHINKNTHASNIDRGMGDKATIGVARSGLLVKRDPDEEEKKYLIHFKCNVGPTQRPSAFRLKSGEFGQPLINWLEYNGEMIADGMPAKKADAVAFIKENGGLAANWDAL